MNASCCSSHSLQTLFRRFCFDGNQFNQFLFSSLSQQQMSQFYWRSLSNQQRQENDKKIKHRKCEQIWLWRRQVQSTQVKSHYYFIFKALTSGSELTLIKMRPNFVWASAPKLVFEVNVKLTWKSGKLLSSAQKRREAKEVWGAHVCLISTAHFCFSFFNNDKD